MNRLTDITTPKVLLLLALIASSLLSQAFAHGVAGGDQSYLMSVEGVQPFPFMYLGAKHMVTGYDHLLYLACVIFFLTRLKRRCEVCEPVCAWPLDHTVVWSAIWHTRERLFYRCHYWFISLLQSTRKPWHHPLSRPENCRIGFWSGAWFWTVFKATRSIAI